MSFTRQWFNTLCCGLAATLLVGCAGASFPNQQPVDQIFPQVKGETLTQQTLVLPDDLPNEPVLLLLGFKQDSQFDIDRWLIGLDMTETDIIAYEVPTIQGLIPRMFKTTINDGMRAGIPKSLWGGVVTVYSDGETLQAFTGNQNPNNARVMLLDRSRTIRYFYDQGFSVEALNALRGVLQELPE